MKRIFLGFTLIELLVVISILGILVGIGLASYNEFNRKQILVQSVKTLKNDLRFAQSKALSGAKDCSTDKCGGSMGGCGNDTGEKQLDGWYIEFTTNSYTIYGSCGGTTFFGAKTVNLTNITLAASPSIIKFRPLTYGVAEVSTITLTGFGQSQVVQVSNSGDIN